MQSFTTIIAASVLIAGAFANPIKLGARATCGSEPDGSGSQTPLSKPAGITTAAACQEQCDANTSCMSFVFGMLNNADQCMLFSVAAASIPKQASTNLVVYDRACSAVPSVIPTTSNPQGFATGSTSSGSTGNTGSTGPTGSSSSAGPNNGAAPAHKRANTCGAAPTDPASINSVAACKAQCSTESSCKSFEFGTMTPGGAQVCKLFPIAAASIPAPTSGQSIVVYDIGSSV